MAKNRPSGKKSPEVAPPTSRRSARQERLASRDSGRSLTRASTSGGRDSRPILLITGLVAIVAVVVIAAAFIATQPKAVTDTPIAPGAALTTPSGIPTNGRTLGNANAPVTLELWSDFRCTGCFQFMSDREPLLVQNFVKSGKLKITYNDFLTIDSNGVTESRDAANAAWCAADQGKFWVMHDWLFANQSPAEAPGAFTIDRLVQIGQAAGLDMTSYQACVRNGSHLSDIAAEKVPSDATFTPATYIDGKQIVGPLGTDGQPTVASYDVLAAAINAKLNPSASPSASSPAATAASPSPSAS